MKVSLVIPALNEEGIVGRTIKSIPVDEIKEAGYEVEIIVVNNDSTDNTEQEAREAGATVFLEKNRGYGNAYQRGFKEASGDILIMGDADGTYPLEQAMDFINLIVEDGCDFVIGSRFDGTIEDGAMPALHKYIGNPMLTKMLNIFFHSDYSDTHCGMRAFTKEAYSKMTGTGLNEALFSRTINVPIKEVTDETIDNYTTLYEEYKEAYNKRKSIIENLYNEIKIIKKLKV